MTLKLLTCEYIILAIVFQINYWCDEYKISLALLGVTSIRNYHSRYIKSDTIPVVIERNKGHIGEYIPLVGVSWEGRCVKALWEFWYPLV